jgi:predicted 2-oxoglutarate/Fe(II)-dependent dioxygenase YbiX
MPNLTDVVDLDQYPIDQPESAEYRRLVDHCRDSLGRAGVATLPGFIRPGGQARLVAQAEAVARLGFANDAQSNVYFTDPDPTLPPAHPNRHLVRSAQKAVAMDQLSPDFGTRVAYESAELTRFAADVLGKEQLFRSADPLDGCNMTVYETGDELGWHFDNSEFSITLMIQPAERGGVFQYVPDTRTIDDESFERVGAILGGDHHDVVSVSPAAGELSIFRGRFALHRVTPVEGDRPRYNSVLTYAVTPNHKLSTLTAELFYGRTGR